uniref:Secreted protein n=1 Tax=Glossina brevipalpis TaxID=37001 RepID=A0A1A9WRH3_9MUSC
MPPLAIVLPWFSTVAIAVAVVVAAMPPRSISDERHEDEVSNEELRRLFCKRWPKHTQLRNILRTRMTWPENGHKMRPKIAKTLEKTTTNKPKFILMKDSQLMAEIHRQTTRNICITAI